MATSTTSAITAAAAAPRLALERFHLEGYFAKHEFVAQYLLCCSDAESMSMKSLLALADEECRVLWDNLCLGYTETKGLPVLREQIVLDYESRTVIADQAAATMLSADSVLCFAGGEEAIYCAFKALLSTDDHCVVVTPCYQSLKSVPESLCSVTCIDLLADDGWALDVKRIERAMISGRTKLIVVNFPHNPTGCTISTEQQDALIAVARAYGAWIFCDEIYRGVERDPADALDPIALRYERGISLGGMSKVYGMAGLRVGWIVSQSASVIQEVSEVKHYLSICNSAPSEVLSLIALRSKALILARTKALIAANEARLCAVMEQHPGLLSWVRPRGGCCGFVRVQLPMGCELSSVAEALVTQHGVLILPGEFFPVAATTTTIRPTTTTPTTTERDGEEASVRQHFRIGLGRADFPKVLDKFVDALKSVLEQLDRS